MNQMLQRLRAQLKNALAPDHPARAVLEAVREDPSGPEMALAAEVIARLMARGREDSR